MMKGICSPYVRLKVIEANVQSEADLFRVMVSAMANAMQAYMLDMDVIPHLESFAAMTTFEEHGDQADEPMINKVEDGKCLRLQHKGHHTKDKVMVCAFCHLKGHPV